MRSSDKRARKKRLHRKTTERAKERQALERERATEPWGFRILHFERILELDDDQIEMMFARLPFGPVSEVADKKRDFIWTHHYMTELMYGQMPPEELGEAQAPAAEAAAG